MVFSCLVVCLWCRAVPTEDYGMLVIVKAAFVLDLKQRLIPSAIHSGLVRI